MLMLMLLLLLLYYICAWGVHLYICLFRAIGIGVFGQAVKKEIEILKLLLVMRYGHLCDTIGLNWCFCYVAHEENVDEKKKEEEEGKKSSPMLPSFGYCVVTAESWCCGYRHCRCRCCCPCDDCWLLYFLFIISSSSSSLLCVAKLFPLSFTLTNVSVLFWNFFLYSLTSIVCIGGCLAIFFLSFDGVCPC